MKRRLRKIDWKLRSFEDRWWQIVQQAKMGPISRKTILDYFADVKNLGSADTITVSRAMVNQIARLARPEAKHKQRTAQMDEAKAYAAWLAVRWLEHNYAIARGELERDPDDYDADEWRALKDRLEKAEWPGLVRASDTKPEPAHPLERAIVVTVEDLAKRGIHIGPAALRKLRAMSRNA